MKKVLFILALLLASGTFVGCGGGDDDPVVTPSGGGGNSGGNSGDNTGGGSGDNTGGGSSDTGGGSGDTGGGSGDNTGGDEQKETKPTWTMNSTSQYEYTMSVWVNASGSTYDDALAVFCGSECRGIGQLITLSNNTKVWCVLVYGTGSETSNLTVKYWSNANSKTYTASESFAFTSDGQYGTADNPKTLTFK